MYFSTYRDKKFGLSKEGSGRVAVLKYTGLIRSYTLECNYNTGRFVNFIPPPAHFVSERRPIQSLVPPKFTPTVFEQVKNYKCIKKNHIYILLFKLFSFYEGWKIIVNFYFGFVELKSK